MVITLPIITQYSAITTINFTYTIFFCCIFRLDINQSAFSPTELDDTFLYIHLPRASSEPVEQQSNKISIVNSQPATAPITSITKPDFTKHTAPCQKFIPETSKRRECQAFVLFLCINTTENYNKYLLITIPSSTGVMF